MNNGYLLNILIWDYYEIGIYLLKWYWNYLYYVMFFQNPIQKYVSIYLYIIISFGSMSSLTVDKNDITIICYIYIYIFCITECTRICQNMSSYWWYFFTNQITNNIVILMTSGADSDEKFCKKFNISITVIYCHFYRQRWWQVEVTSCPYHYTYQGSYWHASAVRLYPR